jgi:hypothetical protein
MNKTDPDADTADLTIDKKKLDKLLAENRVIYERLAESISP